MTPTGLDSKLRLRVQGGASQKIGRQPAQRLACTKHGPQVEVSSLNGLSQEHSSTWSMKSKDL